MRQATVGLLGVCLLAPAFAQPATQTQPGLPGPFGGNYGPAIADCEEALKLHPDDPYAHDNLGIIALKRGEWAKAISRYDASLKVDPKRSPALASQPAIAGEFTRYGVR